MLSAALLGFSRCSYPSLLAVARGVGRRAAGSRLRADPPSFRQHEVNSSGGGSESALSAGRGESAALWRQRVWMVRSEDAAGRGLNACPVPRLHAGRSVGLQSEGGFTAGSGAAPQSDSPVMGLRGPWLLCPAPAVRSPQKRVTSAKPLDFELLALSRITRGGAWRAGALEQAETGKGAPAAQ